MKERTVIIHGERCRRPQCFREAVSRGLCASCYQVAYQMVNGGQTTWEELERRGKVAEVKRSAKTWFLS